MWITGCAPSPYTSFSRNESAWAVPATSHVRRSALGQVPALGIGDPIQGPQMLTTAHTDPTSDSTSANAPLGARLPSVSSGTGRAPGTSPQVASRDPMSTCAAVSARDLVHQTDAEGLADADLLAE